MEQFFKIKPVEEITRDEGVAYRWIDILRTEDGERFMLRGPLCTLGEAAKALDNFERTIGIRSACLAGEVSDA